MNELDAAIRTALARSAPDRKPDWSDIVERANRRLRRRPLVVAAVVGIAVAIAVPAALALTRGVWETPQQFIADAQQAPNAREAVENYLRDQGIAGYELDSVRAVLTAQTPDGELGVYALKLEGGEVGTALISSTKTLVAAMTWGPPTACSGPWAIQPQLSFLAHPGSTPVYVVGRVSPTVSSLDIEYEDGRLSPATVADGYFLAWTAAPYEVRSPFSLVAYDVNGKAIGRLGMGPGGAVAPPPSHTDGAPSCG